MGRWSARVWVVLSVVLLVVCVGLALWFSRLREGPDLAQVIGLPLAALGVVVAVVLGVPRRSRPSTDALGEAARGLAEQLGRARWPAWQRMLLDERVAADLVLEPLPGSALPAGRLSTVLDTYAGATDGRLVLLGPSGAGKTMLATELQVRLLERDWPEGATGDRVPVMLSLSAWDQGDDLAAATLVARLDRWVAATLVKDKLVVDPAVAEALVAGRRVLLILDGLDEMDEVDAAPVRAAGLLRALNVRQGPRPTPFVLTSREVDYDRVRAHLAESGETGVHGADAVRLRPLTVDEIEPAVEEFFRPGAVPPEWAAVVAELRRSNSRLAAGLTTPWHLFLLLSAYRGRLPDVDELSRQAAEPDGVVPHLLDRLLPAVVRAAPPPATLRFDATDAERWLGFIADTPPTETTGPEWGRPLYPHAMWPRAGRWRPRILHAIVVVVALAGPTTAILLAVLPGLGRLWSGVGVVSGLLTLPLVVGSVGSVVVALWIAMRVPVNLAEVDLRVLRRRPELGTIVRRTARWSGFALVCAIIALLLFSGLTDLGFGLLLGGNTFFAILLWGLAFETVLSVTRVPDRLVRPSDLIRGDLLHGAATATVLGVTLLPVGYLFGGTEIAVQLLFVVVWLSVINAAAGIRYLCAVAILAARGRVPRRLGVFLDWAHAAGLLRLAGIALQFRHAELQAWLARRYAERDGRLAEPSGDPAATRPVPAPGS